MVFRINDIEGEKLNELKGPEDAGLHLVLWNMTSIARNNNAQGSGRGGGFRGFPGGRPVPSGAYRVTLVVDGKDVQSHVVNLSSDPSLVEGAVADEVYEAMLMQDQWEEEKETSAINAGRDVISDD